MEIKPIKTDADYRATLAEIDTLMPAGLTARDLEPFTGRSNRVYEILNRKRPLTLAMIWKLHQGLGIPAESLIKPVKLATA